MEKDIWVFQGQYKFLSNSYRKEIEFNNRIYPTTWHAFYAQRATTLPDHDYIASAVHARAARARSKRIKPALGWDLGDTKLVLMHRILQSKFSDPAFAYRLCATGALQITFTGQMADTYWGSVHAVGRNHLGRLLMEVRSELNGHIAAAFKHMQEGHPSTYT
jgi:predicted NAD-dependent protein-ADP-ribosyltransferase YbiA (DUF1768 family)